MSWRWMRLRNADVLARSNEEGDLLVDKGRVEIRYKPNDGRAYFAAVSNLEPSDRDPNVVPDSFCAPAQAVPKRAVRNASEFPVRPSGSEILAYADGACSGNPGPAGIGVVALWDNRRRELSEYLGEATNNIAELTAILRAIDLALELDRPLRLYTDSRYSIGVLTMGWKARANKELVATLRQRLKEHPDVELFHVRGHQGIPLNERADELAVQAVRERRSTQWADG